MTAIELAELRAACIAVEPEVRSSELGRTPLSPFQQSRRDPGACERTSHRESVDEGAFAIRHLGPDLRIRELEPHRRGGLAVDRRQHEFTGGEVPPDQLRMELILRPERYAPVTEPVGGFQEGIADGSKIARRRRTDGVPGNGRPICQSPIPAAVASSRILGAWVGFRSTTCRRTRIVAARSSAPAATASPIAR